jgi:hypothetical protein
MSPEDETSDTDTPAGTADAELFDSALDVGLADDGVIDNPNFDT